MNKDEAQLIAAAVHKVRPEWHQPGVMATLEKLQSRSFDDCMHAALNAAKTRPDQRTPAIIAMDGEHWNGTKYGQAHPATTVTPAGPRCETCNRTSHAHGIAETKVRIDQRHEWSITPPPRQHFDLTAVTTPTI